MTDLVNRFIGAPEDFDRQSRAGRNLVDRKFSTETYPHRMRELYENLELLVPAAISASLGDNLHVTKWRPFDEGGTRPKI